MIHGIPSSPGQGVGPAVIIRQRSIRHEALVRASESGHEGELKRYLTALPLVEAYYRRSGDRVRQRLGNGEAEIFEGYLELLAGDDIREGVEELLRQQDQGSGPAPSAEGAVLTFCETTAGEFMAMESSYFRQRADDIRDIGRRLAEAIHFGDILDIAALDRPSIILAEELSPAHTVSLDPELVAGIATETGGPTSHAAILARSLSIPCVTGAPGLLATIQPGDFCLVDGSKGIISPGVSPEEAKEILEKENARKLEDGTLREWSRNTASMLSDGTEVLLKANVSSPADAQRAADAGARGSGLVRSEFIFLTFNDFPSVEQQYEEYRKICSMLSPHTVTIRLLDCGADKPLPYADQEHEDNPFLGERGVRFLLRREQILADQLTAIGRLHRQGFPVRAMIPMVVDPGEIRQVRAMLRGIEPDLPLGIMVETPASVFAIDALAAECDFLSVGTNDLVQYLMAVDRGNSRVAGLFQELNPAVISALGRIAAAAEKAGTPLGVCGDMASRPETALALLALGIRELSSSSAELPRLKQLIRSLDETTLGKLGQRLAGGTSHEENLDLLRQTLDEIMGGTWR